MARARRVAQGRTGRRLIGAGRPYGEAVTCRPRIACGWGRLPPKACAVAEGVGIDCERTILGRITDSCKEDTVIVGGIAAVLAHDFKMVIKDLIDSLYSSDLLAPSIRPVGSDRDNGVFPVLEGSGEID